MKLQLIPRFSLSRLLIAVSAIAVFAAALAGSNYTWCCIVGALALGSLIGGAVAAIYRRGAARAFLVGFEICGWAYFLMAYWLGATFRDVVGTELLWNLAEQLGREDSSKIFGEDVPHFVFIAKMAITLLSGLLGGWLARHSYVRSKSDIPTRSESKEP